MAAFFAMRYKEVKGHWPLWKARTKPGTAAAPVAPVHVPRKGSASAESGGTGDTGSKTAAKEKQLMKATTEIA